MAQTKLRTAQMGQSRYFYAHQTNGNATSISAGGTGYPVICDTAEKDDNSIYNTTTGKCTPDLAGTYRFTANGALKGMNSNKGVWIGLRKTYNSGGDSKKRWIAIATSSGLGYGGAGGTLDIYLNGVDDYVEFIIWNGDTVARDTYDTYSNAVFWKAERISDEDICGY